MDDYLPMPRSVNRQYKFRNLEELHQALLSVEQALDTAARRLYRVQIETNDLRIITCADLRTALTDDAAHNVALIVDKDDYHLTIRANLRKLTIKVVGYGQVPSALVKSVDREFRLHSRPGDSLRWPARAWNWFRAQVWAGMLAQVLGGIVILLITPQIVAWLKGLS
ncbi:hypothetical protein AB0I81_11235 [Nonomuraea sp. NPDC050404]|uniref:hypothetical protein n=1 Tax=Nonomuraea sp. NPDC050404 TaxID=3155783 RepID=UPI0034055DD6